MKRRVILFLSLLMLFCLSSQPTLAASNGKITVNVPIFKVTLNGVKIDNSHREYPMLTYKDITYFPLTYIDSQFLGIETTWDNRTGLSVNVSKGAFSWSPDETYTATKNKITYTASIPQFPVRVNGELIDNSTETYPLIQFRNVTYFPLTWHFAMDEFHWRTYSFTAKDGLVINSFDPPPSYEDALPALHQGLVDGPAQYEKNGSNQSANQNGQNDQSDPSVSKGQDKSGQGYQKDSNDQSVTNGQ